MTNNTPAVNLKVNQVARLIRDGYEFRLAELDGITPMTADEAREYIELMQRNGYRATAPKNLFNTYRARWFTVDIERTQATPKIIATRMGRDDELAASIYGQVAHTGDDTMAITNWEKAQLIVAALNEKGAGLESGAWPIVARALDAIDADAGELLAGLANDQTHVSDGYPPLEAVDPTPEYQDHPDYLRLEAADVM